ncbi:hypothetical protein AC96_2218 [Escherichia coli 2-156-04_S4_C2]|nr:hypothetical protein AC96_2218 [Escherichia coli 2-156-04_S4_C2]
MDGIQPANINRVQPHGIIGTRRNKCGQTLPSFRIFAPSVRRWRPGWSFLFTFNGSHPVTRGFSPSLADTNRKDFHSITVWWVVIKTHLSDVNNNPFTNSGGQNQLLRNGELRARLRQKTSAPGFASSMLLNPCPYCAAKVSSGWVL